MQQSKGKSWFGSLALFAGSSSNSVVSKKSSPEPTRAKSAEKVCGVWCVCVHACVRACMRAYECDRYFVFNLYLIKFNRLLTQINILNHRVS